LSDISATNLKSILHSKRANIYYLEHCRVLVNGGRVEYVTDEGKRSLYWNIPIANTTTVLLGTGTSVTQAAMRELAKAGVLVLPDRMILLLLGGECPVSLVFCGWRH
jgi:CRISP-associated protein Cas1